MITTRRQQVAALIERQQYCSAYNVAKAAGLDELAAGLVSALKTGGATSFRFCDKTGQLKSITFSKQEELFGG